MKKIFRKITILKTKLFLVCLFVIYLSTSNNLLAIDWKDYTPPPCSDDNNSFPWTGTKRNEILFRYNI